MRTIVLVTPVYATRDNRRLELLRVTLQSILDQELDADVRLVSVIVDDGSTSDVAALVNEVGDDRVRYIRRERTRGDANPHSRALNLGIDSSLGDGDGVLSRAERSSLRALAVVHSDDLLSSDSVRRRLAALDDGFVHTDMAIFHANEIVRVRGGREFDVPCLADKLSDFVRFNHLTLMWDAGFLSAVRAYMEDRFGQRGVFDTNLWHGEDRDLSISCAMMAAKTGASYRYVPFASVFYRLHRHSITAFTVPADLAAQNRRLARKHAEYLPSVPPWTRVGALLYSKPWDALMFLPEPVKGMLRPAGLVIRKRLRSKGEPDSELRRLLAGRTSVLRATRIDATSLPEPFETV